MGWEGKRCGGGSITDAETLQGKPANYFAAKKDLPTKSCSLDVCDFGAIGDFDILTLTGTDDSDAIQEALNSGKPIRISKKHYVTKELTFKSYAKIIFDGGQILTDSSFDGVAVLHCTSQQGSSDSNGYMINPDIQSIDDLTNACAIKMDHCQNFQIFNLKSIGYKKEGVLVESGYEFILNGFNIVASRITPTRNFETLQAGLWIKTSDCEVSNGAVVAYPVGVKSNSNNNFVNVHCWGLPSTGNVNDTRVMLYPFLTYEKGNNYINCFADTPDVLDLSLPAGGLNGGVGFIDWCDTSIIPNAWPYANNYINCRILKSNISANNKIIGFEIGSPTVDGIGTKTKIIAPTYLGTGFDKYVKCNSERSRWESVIIDPFDRGPLPLSIIGSKVDNVSGGYINDVDRVFVNVKFTAKTTSNNSIIFSGLPKNSSAIINRGLLSGYNITDDTETKVYVDVVNGYLTGDFVTDKIYVASGWYSII